MSQRVPLDLYGEVTTSSGARFKWDANQSPDSRPQNLGFRTKIGEGYSDGSLQFARRIDQDYPDLNLVDNVTFTGADGFVAYEGRNSAMPRDLGERHGIGVTLAGWMAHAKDRKFQDVIVDRDPSHWIPPALSRNANLAGASIHQGDITWQQDRGGMMLAFPTNALGNPRNITELWYIAPPGVSIAKLGYRAQSTGTLTSWALAWYSSASADGTGATSQGAVAFTDTLTPLTLSTPQQAVFLQIDSGGNSVTPTAGTSRRISKIAAYGNHDITLRTGDSTEPDGVYASDAIRYLAGAYCPEFDTSGVQDTSYVIQHLTWPDRTFPYDAFLEVNKYHLWNLAVWENKRLCFEPYDLTDYDWEIRIDDTGTTFSPQGPTTESLFNGIALTYTDPIAGPSVLDPDDSAVLRDESPDNPWNRNGYARIEHWSELTLSSPTLSAQALELGRAGLADTNRPKTPGTITVRGYIRDRAGNEQPVWKVRAGQTISITNFPNDSPRLIVETDYDDESKTIRIAVDRPFALLDAYLDRLSNGLDAAG